MKEKIKARLDYVGNDGLTLDDLWRFLGRHAGKAAVELVLKGLEELGDVIKGDDHRWRRNRDRERDAVAIEPAPEPSGLSSATMPAPSGKKPKAPKKR